MLHHGDEDLNIFMQEMQELKKVKTKTFLQQLLHFAVGNPSSIKKPKHNEYIRFGETDPVSYVGKDRRVFARYKDMVQDAINVVRVYSMPKTIEIKKIA